MIHVRNAQNLIALAIRDTILYGIGRRIDPVASVAALRLLATRGQSSSQRNADDLATVVSAGVPAPFRWFPSAMNVDDGASWVRPADVPQTSPGRWGAWTYPVRYSPVVDGDSYLLHEIATFSNELQPVRRVLLLDKHMEPTDVINRVFGQTPSVVIAEMDDDPDDLTLDAGNRWRGIWSFSITVVSKNLRNRREAAEGSNISADETVGANVIDGMIWELLAGAGDGRMNAVLDGIINVNPSTGANEVTLLDERVVLRSRTWRVAAVVELPQAPNEVGAPQALYAQANLTDLGAQPAFDASNLVTLGCGVPVGQGLVKPCKPGTAVIVGAPVTYAGEVHTFGASQDTYRDLAPTGSMTFAAVSNGDPAPDLVTGSMRVGVTVTDDSQVISDTFLCVNQNPIGGLMQALPEE